MFRRLKEWYRKNLKVPSPTELGHTDLDALQSRLIQKFLPDNVYTWEDWEKEVKIRFPVRYFLTETIPSWVSGLIRPWTRRISDAIYFVKCHSLKEYKFHLIDLRQPKGFHYEYRWGYLDPCEQFLLANFTILKDYVENKGPTNLLDSYTMADIIKEGLEEHHKVYLETMEIYNWWVAGRKAELDNVDHLYDEYNNETDETIANKKRQQWWEAREDADKKEDEMLCRLMKIRRSLWY